MPQLLLAELSVRASQAIERNQELRAERELERTRARIERETSRQALSQIRALKEVLGLQSGTDLDAFWHSIELSERYGTLEERTAILLLADAFFRANRDLRSMARRKAA